MVSEQSMVSLMSVGNTDGGAVLFLDIMGFENMVACLQHKGFGEKKMNSGRIRNVICEWGKLQKKYMC